jgi:protoheme ferro-lyase
MKRLNKQLKRAKAANEPTEEILSKISYVRYFPKDKKYISILKDDVEQKVLDKRKIIFDEVMQKS